jgi:O-Antigen ligase
MLDPAAPVGVRAAVARPRDRPPSAGRAPGNRYARMPLVATATAIAMLPLTDPRGPGNLGPIDAFIVVAIGTWAWSSAVSGRRIWFPYALGAGLMILGGALGGLAGPVPAAGVLAIVQDLLLLAWCWTVANVGRSPEHTRVLARTWAYSSIVWGALLLIGLVLRMPALTGQTPQNGLRTSLTFGDPNVAANYYVISMMIICATARPRARWMRFLAYAILTAALVSSGSNSGFLAALLGIAAAAVLGVRRRGGLIPAIACFACLLGAAYLATTAVSLQSIEQRAYTSGYGFLRQGLGRGQQSVSERTKVLSESIRLYETGSPLGEGPVSTKPRLEASMAPYPKEAHDDYFAALMERGVIGAVGIFVLMASTLARSAWLLRRSVRERLVPVLPNPHAIVAAVAGTMVTMTVFELLHVRHVWALFALVAAVSLWGRD